MIQPTSAGRRQRKKAVAEQPYFHAPILFRRLWFSEPPVLFVCTTTLNHVDMAALGGAAMSYKPHQQILTFFDLSKKARPPPGIFLPLDMNY